MSGSILQSGAITPGHAAMWLDNGTVRDAGPASGGDLTQIGVTNDGGQGIGVNSGAVSGPYTGFGVTVSSDGTVQISAGGFNGGPAANLEYVINGVVYSVVNLLPGAAVVSIASIAALRGLVSLIPAPAYNVEGYYTLGDGGGGVFNWIPTDTTSADNGGTIIVDSLGHRYHRQIADVVTWKQFGAKGDSTTSGGGTDDTAAIQAAWNYSAASGGTPAYGPPGKYLTTAPLVMPSGATITGAAPYSGIFSLGWEQSTTIVYQGNVSALAVTDGQWGGVSIENVGFVGDYLTYPNAIGLFLDDAVRTISNVCVLTLRGVMFKWFATGMLIGNKYQTVQGFNVICDSCSTVGAWIKAADCYWYNLNCGNSQEGSHTADASVAQLFVGDSAPLGFAAGVNHFMGGAFFNAKNAVIVKNANSNKFIGCDIQNSQQDGVVVGDNTHSCSGNAFIDCLFSGNNQAGGSGNGNGTFYTDAHVFDFATNTKFIGCNFADVTGFTTKVAGAVTLEADAMGAVVSGCMFNIDNMHHPVSTAQPWPIVFTSSALLLDNISITGNQYTTGLSGGGLGSQEFGQDDAQNQYIANGTISLTSRSAVLNAGIGNTIAMTLPNPQFFGRRLDILLSAGNGTTVTCATANGFNATDTTATFTAAFATLMLVAISPTQWGVLYMNNVTLS